MMVPQLLEPVTIYDDQGSSWDATVMIKPLPWPDSGYDRAALDSFFTVADRVNAERRRLADVISAEARFMTPSEAELFVRLGQEFVAAHARLEMTKASWQ